MARGLLLLNIGGTLKAVKIKGLGAVPQAPFEPLTQVAWTNAYWAESPDLAATSPVEGGRVPSWPDSISTRDLGHPTETSQATYRAAVADLNGKPALQFGGATGATNMRALSYPVTQAYSLVVIGSVEAIGTATQTLLAGSGTSADRRFYLATRNTRISANTILTGTHQVEDFEGFIATAVFDGTSSAVEMQRTRVEGDAGLNGLANLYIGSRNGADVFSGHIAFVGLYLGDVRDDPGWLDFEMSAAAYYDLQVRYRPGPIGSFASTSPIVLGTGADGLASNPTIINTSGPTWHATTIRENGNAVYDPITAQWVMAYSGQASTGGTVKVGISLSPDGLTWTEDAGNPLTGGSTSGEDPYICKNGADGTLHRDSSGRALIYMEEKPAGDASAQRGVDLWRSTPNTLTGWTYYGRVIDAGATPGSWDEGDRTSPIVVFDGSQYVMLYEGRSARYEEPVGSGLFFRDNEGEIGVAYSADGLTFTADPDPIIVRSAASGWYGRGIVTDDLIKVGPLWVMTNHGAKTGQFFTQLGRWSTTDAPADWTAASWTEMAGNPYDIESSTAMHWGNDPSKMLRLTGAERVDLVNVYDGI